jgi:hypothetical protein
MNLTLIFKCKFELVDLLFICFIYLPMKLYIANKLFLNSLLYLNYDITIRKY